MDVPSPLDLTREEWAGYSPHFGLLRSGQQAGEVPGPHTCCFSLEKCTGFLQIGEERTVPAVSREREGRALCVLAPGPRAQPRAAPGMPGLPPSAAWIPAGLTEAPQGPLTPFKVGRTSVSILSAK